MYQNTGMDIFSLGMGQAVAFFGVSDTDGLMAALDRARQHPYLALAWGYIIFLVFTTAVSLIISSRDLVDALLIAFMNTVVYVLLTVFHLRNVRMTARRLERAKVHAGFWVPSHNFVGGWEQGGTRRESGFIGQGGADP